MASFRPPKEQLHEDSIPASLLTPLSPSALPQWLRPGHTRSAMLAKGRRKVILIALGCVLMGWMVTSSLGRSDYDDLLNVAEGHYARPAVVPDDPTGFNAEPTMPRMPAGVIGDALPEDDMIFEIEERPSVKGALAELHSAVKDKLHSWNPYRQLGPPHVAGIAANKTVAHQHEPTSSATTTSGEHILDGMSEEERLGARIRIGKCTILFYGNSAWERAIRTHERHDREHGYRLHILRQQIMDDVWSKPAYILSLLLRELAKPESDRLEWLLWVDADTVLLNPHIPIDVFLPPPGSEFDDIHLVYSNDWNGLNNGVFPVRVNQWAVQLFSAIVSFRHYRPEDALPFRDQSAMDYLLREPAFAPHVVQAPQRWFNAYQGEHNETLAPFQLRRGDFLVHFAGVLNREERMIHWLSRAEEHLDDWEVPLRSTSYPQEARDFWAEQSGLRRLKQDLAANKRLEIQGFLTKVEQSLSDYGERLSPDNRGAIEKEDYELQSLVNDAAHSDNVELMEQKALKLGETVQPLMSAVADAQKLLLNSAHEAIFAGEKDLLEGGSSDGGSSPELESILTRIKLLKDLVVVPQEQWNRQAISAATSLLNESRVQWKSKADAAKAVMKQAEEEQRKKAQAFIESQVQAQAEASNSVPGVGPYTWGSATATVAFAPSTSSTALAGLERM